VSEPQFQDGDGREHAEAPGRILRGCAVAVGIALLVFAFVVGACFISMQP
jgi:hypothetical protein